MSGKATPATRQAAAAGIAHEVVAYEHDPNAASYGLEAAGALGVEPARVFKTLVATVDGGALVVGLVPVERTLDLKALAVATGGKKATLATPAAAERATGYVVGGISPLGQRRRLTVVVDRSLTDHERVYVSAGRRGLEIALAPDDLVRLTTAVVASIARRAPG